MSGDSKEPAKSAAQPQKTRPPWLIPDYPPLTGKAAQAAIKGQILTYPMVVRDLRDPPIPNQTHSNVSFMLLPEAQTLESGKKVFGFFKPRGVWESEATATREAEKLIKAVDSRYQIRIGAVGMWHPITEDNAVCRDLLDVQTQEGQIAGLRDRAAKEAADKQRQIERELRERETQLREEQDTNDDKDHIRYYAMRRVTDMRLTEAIGFQRKRLAEMSYNLLKCRIELKQIEQKFPEHKEGWLDCYNEERAKPGLPPYKPGEHEFDEYEAAQLDELEREFAALEQP